MDFHKTPHFWEYDVIQDGTEIPEFWAYPISNANSLPDNKIGKGSKKKTW
jgi:hypothetical protein